VPLFHRLVRDLRDAIHSFEGRQEILLARSRCGSFNENQFVDLISFCEALTGAQGNGPKARMAKPDKVLSTNSALRRLSHTANAVIGPLRSVIFKNQTSDQNPMIKGTSVYFPLYDSEKEDHERRLGDLYKLLDFAKATGWNLFISEFLRLQKKDLAVAEVLAKPPARPPHFPAPQKFVDQLDKVEKQSKTTAATLNAVARKSKMTASPVNGALSGAAQVSMAVASEVKSVLEASRNGGPGH
jgi:hypothetical protein